MRDMMWIYAVILFASDASFLKPALAGTNQSISQNSNNTSQNLGAYDTRNETVTKGHNVSLECSNKTWNETMFVIWKMTLKYKNCRIAYNNDGNTTDSCNDGKSVRNKSTSLDISNFSLDDEGVYWCELVFTGGYEQHKINVNIAVLPKVSVWIESRNNKMVAVCRAERGKPAANISWSYTGNWSLNKSDRDGFFTVESRLELADDMNSKTLNCSVWHQSWGLRTFSVTATKKGDFHWLFNIIIVALTVLVLVSCVFLVRKKQILLRQCQQSDTAPSKCGPTEDVEEVQPYASYVQRVNSIYN